MALTAILTGALILAAIVYELARLITPAESRFPPLARIRGQRAALEFAERWCVGLHLHDRIGEDAYQDRMTGLAHGRRRPAATRKPRGGRDG